MVVVDAIISSRISRVLLSKVVFKFSFYCKAERPVCISMGFVIGEAWIPLLSVGL